MSSTIDSKLLRQALGQVPTGVTIVTTLDADQQPIGMTVSSFNSVSLDPALVLWSVGREAHAFDAFNAATHTVIHVLNAEQKELCLTFATPGADKFSATDTELNQHGIPMLKDFVARFQCKAYNHYDGGDHVILVSEIEEVEINPSATLTFHRGEFSHLGA